MNAVFALRKQHRIKILCRVLMVSRSTYYKHFFSQIAPRTKENKEIKAQILQIYSEHNKRVGGPKIRFLLQSEYGVNISQGRVYRLMKTMKLPILAQKKPKFRYPQTQEAECPNKLKQQFNPKAPDEVWVSDLTFLKVCGRWHYLCVILDLFARKVVAWKLGSRPDVELVKETFMNAHEVRKPKELMFHTDRGTQYTAFSFRQMLDKLNVVQSFSKKGHPFDNAVMECFFKFLKREQTNRQTYQTVRELEVSIFEYVNYYNKKRPHGTLKFQTPDQREADFFSGG